MLKQLATNTKIARSTFSIFVSVVLNTYRTFLAVCIFKTMNPSKSRHVSWVDYTKHQRKDINFIPPKEIIKKWKKDYADMQESMFYGETESFDNLIEKLNGLKRKTNTL